MLNCQTVACFDQIQGFSFEWAILFCVRLAAIEVLVFARVNSPPLLPPLPYLLSNSHPCFPVSVFPETTAEWMNGRTQRWYIDKINDWGMRPWALTLMERFGSDVWLLQIWKWITKGHGRKDDGCINLLLLSRGSLYTPFFFLLALLLQCSFQCNAWWCICISRALVYNQKLNCIFFPLFSLLSVPKSFSEPSCVAR